MAVVVGVDGAGRTFRLRRLAGESAWWAAGDVSSVEAGLARAREDGALVVVDDAHRLGPDALALLASAAREGVPMVISRRPTIGSPELAALDEAVAAGGVEVAGPLDPDEVARLIASATGRTVSPETAAAVHEASAGLAVVAAALAGAIADALAAAGGSGAGGRPGASGGAGAGRGGPGSGRLAGGAGAPRGAGPGPSGVAASGGAGAPASSAAGTGAPGGAGSGRSAAGAPGVTGAGRSTGGAGASGGVGREAAGSPGGVGSGLSAAGARGAGRPGGGAGALVAEVLGRPAPVLVARVQRRFAVLPPAVSAVARVLALRLELGDDVLAAAAGDTVDGLPATMRILRDEGLLSDERMIPAISAAVLGELSAAERRRLHDSVGRALAAAGAEPVVAATQLRAARVRTPAVAPIYVRAGEATRFTDPAAALAWFDDADEAGADPADTTAGRAEAGALLGLPVDADPGTGDSRLARLAGAAAAHDGRAERAADTLLAVDPALAVPVLVGIGRLDQARAATKGDRFAEAALAAAEDPDAAVPLLIEAAELAERTTATAVLPDTPHAVGAIVAVVAGDLAAAEHLLARAAAGPGTAAGLGTVAGPGTEAGPGTAAGFGTAAGPLGTAGLGPEGAGAGSAGIGAGPGRAADSGPAGVAGAGLAGVAGGGVGGTGLAGATGVGLAGAAGGGTGGTGSARAVVGTGPEGVGLERAGAGTRVAGAGPAAAQRHRLLLAWARMRAGRYDTALAELARPAGELLGRERLLRAAIAAGIARRRGDIAGLRAVWGGVEPVLARRVVDLWQLEAAEELLVAAARLHQRRRVDPVLELLERTVDGLGRPAAWAAALGWLRVQVAVAAGEPGEVAAQADRLPAGAGPRGDAQRAAAKLWAEVLAGTATPPDTVLAVTDDLAAAQLPWEASRLAGQAAIHTTDPAAARRLLERARELSEPDSGATEPQPVSNRASGLSERELAVAKLVVAGSTHKEIGAQLYIAPKTVEHHVARIRSKLGAGSRAELLAVLREIVSDPG